MPTPSNRGSMDKWLALSGVAFVVITAVAVVGLGGSTPSSGDSGSKIRSFYEDDKAREFIGVFVLIAATPFLLLFTTSLANAVAGTGRRSVWQLLFLGGSVATAFAWIITASLHFALLDGVDQKISDTALEALNTLDGNTWIVFVSALGLMMLGAGGMLLTASVTAGYRRLGWVAAILGVALFIPFADFFALLLTGIWIIVTSVMAARAQSPLVAAGTSPPG